MDENDRVNLLLLADSLDDVSGGQVHGDWITAASDLVAETLDFTEGALKSILWHISFESPESEVPSCLPIEPRTASCPWQR